MEDNVLSLWFPWSEGIRKECCKSVLEDPRNHLVSVHLLLGPGYARDAFSGLSPRPNYITVTASRYHLVAEHRIAYSTLTYRCTRWMYLTSRYMIYLYSIKKNNINYCIELESTGHFMQYSGLKIKRKENWWRRF